jgi:hypothetical protein
VSRFEGAEALAAKIAWEGGMEMALDYGIKTEDMPEGYITLMERWADMQAKWETYREAAELVEELLPDQDTA